MKKIETAAGLKIELIDGMLHITKPNDEQKYVLRQIHSPLPINMFEHYATDGVDSADIADILQRIADQSYEGV